MWKEIIAKNDGSPHYLSYGDTDCFSPNQKYKTRWVYDGEPPHGDSWHLVWLDDKLLPGCYWGRGHAWSPDSEYFTLEKYDKNECVLYVVRAIDLHWFKVSVNSLVKSLLYPNIVFREYLDLLNKHKDCSPLDERYIFSGEETWSSIDFKLAKYKSSKY
jgi:hypothetical protein